MGIIEASQRLDYDDDPTDGTSKDVGKIFVGDPFQVDKEVSETLGIRTDYLQLIKMAESGMDTI
jgi:hypothetical protein